MLYCITLKVLTLPPRHTEVARVAHDYLISKAIYKKKNSFVLKKRGMKYSGVLRFWRVNGDVGRALIFVAR